MKYLIVSLTIFVTISFLSWKLARASGSFSTVAIFSYKHHPDFPRSEFINGRLGVLQPTFARSYLVIAYRYLNGIGMSAGEREQALDYYKDRDTQDWDHSGEDWPERWRAARARIRFPFPPATSLITKGQWAYDPETHSFVVNCLEDAYRVALHTMESRRARFGVSTAAFRSWLTAQDQVFRNCDGPDAAIPAEASANLPPLIRSDREYQIAAAYFYAGYYQNALERFRRIGGDQSSPWSNLSRYLVLRTLFMMAQIPESAEEARSQLKTETDRVLDDPKLVSIHGMSWKLARLADIREANQAYFVELAHLLSTRGQDNGLREELWNFTTLYDSIIGSAAPYPIFFTQREAAPTDTSRLQETDLSDWIFSFQSRDSSVFSHALDRWKQTRSPAWLIAALSHATAEGANRSGLLAAAASIPESSPAYLSARFHLLRLDEELGEKSAALDGLNSVLSGPALNGLPSSINLFRGLRMLAAPAFGEFLKFSLRKPVMITWDDDGAEKPYRWSPNDTKTDESGMIWNAYQYYKGPKFPTPVELLDRDATQILNRKVPFRLFKGMALGTELPLELRREALMMAFTRGLMLGEDLSEVATQIGEEQPDLNPLTESYRAETTESGRRFAAAFLLLHRPEARPYLASGIPRQTLAGKIDNFHDNWWCPMDIEARLDSRANLDELRYYTTVPNVLQKSTEAATPQFVTDSVASEAKREWEKLATLGGGPDFLGSIVLEFAKSNPGDPRVPEALYGVVRSSRYGCEDIDTWKTSRAAFRLLHTRYPKSEWAKRTPYWFKGYSNVRSEIGDTIRFRQ